MNRYAIGVFCSIYVIVVAAMLGRESSWPHEHSDLPADPEIHWGELDNGFRYALMPRSQKPGVVSMRLLVEVGSIDESPKEQGLAHFVEHMAFRGTRHFEHGELISFFQKLGMSYGVDVNAFTYPDKTVYHLELPQNSPDLVSQALELYRDYADGILFNAEKIDTEREIVLREKQGQDMPSVVAARESSGFAFDGTRLASRDPIGLEEVILGASRRDMVDFYKKWYRPDLMTLVVVGDIDPDQLAEEVSGTFSSMIQPKKGISKRKMGKLARSKSFRSGYKNIEGVDRRTLKVFRTWMEATSVDSYDTRTTDTIRSFATALFNERARRATDGMSGDYAYYERVFDMPHCQFSISAPGDDWMSGYLWMDRMIRQVLDYGFKEDEIVFLKKNWLQISRSGASRYYSADPRDLIDDLVDHIATDRVYLSSQTYQEYFDETVLSLTKEQIDQSFKEVWDLKHLSYFMVGEFEKGPTRTDLKKSLKADRKYTMLPYIDQIPGDFEYTDLGAPGVVVEKKVMDGIGASMYRFANNARLTFLHTENEKETVRALVRIGGGMLSFHDTNPATHALAMQSLFRSGFGDKSIEDVYSELRNNVLSFVFGVDDHDAFTYRAVSSSEGLDEFLGIVSEYLFAPKISDEAFNMSQTKLRQSREFEGDGLNEGYRNLTRLIYPDQPRFHSPSLTDIGSVGTESVRDWLDEPFREGYLEVAIVGDVDEEKVVEMFGQTLGALPIRHEKKLDYSDARSLRIKTQKGKRRIEYDEGKGENAASVVVWTIQDDISFRESVTLYVLSAVLENRIRERVREEMGASYSPTAHYVSYPAYDYLRHIRIDVDCLSDDADNLLDVVIDIANGLSLSEIGLDELHAAVAPMEEGIRLAWRDNSYLLENVLYGAQEYPEVSKNALKYREGVLSSVTPIELRELAKRYLVPEEALAVAIVPEIGKKITGTLDVENRKKAGSTKR